jgi:hypothetical protein
MSIGIFTDKHQQPTDNEVQQSIGSQRANWQALLDHIRTNYPADEDFKFLYGKRYGWALRFRICGKLLTSLYPAADGFTVQINLDPRAVIQAEALPLNDNARQAIGRATPYPEGRWVFIPVQSAADRRDVEQLLALRVATKRLDRMPTESK